MIIIVLTKNQGKFIQFKIKLNEDNNKLFTIRFISNILKFKVDNFSKIYNILVAFWEAKGENYNHEYE